MGKKVRSQRTLKANIYENDYEELLYSTNEHTKIKHIDKPKRTKERPLPQSTKTKEDQLYDDRDSLFGPPISERTVPCKCNKCGHKLNGKLISMIFSPVSNLMTPFISYKCDACQHKGHRSVKEKALPPKEFEKYYF